MLFRLVRPMKRSGSAIPQFVQRIPADLRGRVAGLKLAIPPGDDNFHHVVISDNARDLRFSLQPRDFATAKIRQAVALAGKLYRAWVSSEGKERTTAVILTPRGFVMDRSGLDGDEDEALFLSVSERLQATQNSGDAADLEPILGRPPARQAGAKDQLGCIWLWRCNSFLPDGLSKRAAIGHRAFNGDVAERLKALVC
jgi:hypothetical protein